MISDAFNFENIVENAVATLLTAYGLNVYTSGQVADYYKTRPSARVVFQLGKGHLQWVGKSYLPDELQGQKLESAWSATLSTLIFTAAGAQGKLDQSAYRAAVRLAYCDLGPQLNGTLLTLHKINITEEEASTRAIDPEKNIEELTLVHRVELSMQPAVWSQYVRITVSPSGPAIRITI